MYTRVLISLHGSEEAMNTKELFASLGLAEEATAFLPAFLNEKRNHLHKHPELSLKEYETASYIENTLRAEGYITRRVGETGICTSVTGEKSPSDKVLVLRADIDALPITEENAVPYASETEGCMHACGHDIHTASLLGAAAFLQRNRHLFSGTVRFFFQQAEEIGQGARQFIQENLDEGADRVFGFHIDPTLPLGTCQIASGCRNASVDYLRIEIEGRESHVSRPEQGADAIFVLSSLIVKLQSIVTRLTAPTDPVVLGIGKIEGGRNYNIVAGSASAEGTLRCTTIETRKKILGLIQRFIEEEAALYGAKGRLITKDFASPLINSELVTDELFSYFTSLKSPLRIKKERPLSLGGDDFAELLLRTPGVYAFLGTENSEKGYPVSELHHGRMLPDPDTLLVGVFVHLSVVLCYLS